MTLPLRSQPNGNGYRAYQQAPDRAGAEQWCVELVDGEYLRESDRLRLRRVGDLDEEVPGG